MRLLIASLALVASGAIAGDDIRQGCWDTIVQALRRDDPPPSRDVDVKLPGGGSVRLRHGAVKSPRGLVLVICGTFGDHDNGYASDAARAVMADGYDVVVMDAFLSPAVVSRARIGMPGNLRNEALAAANAILGFQKAAGSKLDVSVVGVSYGGAVALQMAALEAEGKLPIALSRVLALSVPASFRSSMRMLDEYEGLPCSYDKIIPIVMAARPGAAMPDVPLDELEKTIGRGFRLALASTVELADRTYQVRPSPGEALGLEALGHPGSERMERDVEAAAIGFRAFFSYWVAPYWAARGVSADDLLGYGEMSKVLPGLGKKVWLVLASDDPLNERGAAEGLLGAKTGARVTVLPRGGHAAFVRTAVLNGIVDEAFGKLAGEPRLVSPARSGRGGGFHPFRLPRQ